MSSIEAGHLFFKELEWDSNFFHVKAGKIILHDTLTETDKNEFLNISTNYDFITIENRFSNALNAQFIGANTQAFLADVNVQYRKKIKKQHTTDDQISCVNLIDQDERMIQIAEYKYSRFLEDPKLKERSGALVYENWLLNAFHDPNKYFIVSKDQNGVTNGFILYVFNKENCVIELIAVDPLSSGGGIGSRMFCVLENELFSLGIDSILVGTQIKNLNAINFYHKMGCQQIGCHQIYHLWNNNSC